MNKNKGILILGYTAIGKTTLAKKYLNVCDLESSPYRWVIPNFNNIDKEKLKGTKKIPNNNWPHNYIDSIKRNLHLYDFVLVWPHSEVLEQIKNIEAKTIFVAPSKKSLNICTKRCIDRGNSTDHIKKIISIYDNKIKEINKYNINKYFLYGNDTLETFLVSKKYKLIKKYQSIEIQNHYMKDMINH